MIDFIIVSSDLRPYVLDTRVKRGAELSTDHHLVRKQSLGAQRWVLFISGAEVVEAVKQLPSSGAPGVDEIRPGYLKALDVVGLSWLTRLYNIAWNIGGSTSGVANWGGGPHLEERGTRGSNLRFKRNNVVFVLVVEQWTSSLPTPGIWGGCPLIKGHSIPVLYECEFGSHCRHTVGEGVRFGDLRIPSLLFADDVVLLASSSSGLQLSLGRFAAEYEAAGMRISTSKSEAMVLSRKGVYCPLRVGEEFLPQVEEFKYLGVLFT
ncbi:hypothetical protein L3Q82_024232, partial [Scortum barcoo]